MNRPIAILLGVALLLSADAVFARGGRGGGGHAGGGGFHGGGTSMGFHGGGTSMGFHGGGTSMGFHGGHGGIATVGARFAHPIGRPFVGVRPGFVGRPPFFRHRVFVGSTVVIGAPFFYPYYPYYPYYPPAYAAPYAEPPAYIEQSGRVYYYCPDYNDYYPNVSSCPSQWVPVSANAGEYPQ
ncbi:MAG: hypothetical protein E6H42_04720 [Betaproteobacteria bacterium]|nr:MAG: hypothetical protein E6H42_04720 [Betaproteobacteria bacterium]